MRLSPNLRWTNHEEYSIGISKYGYQMELPGVMFLCVLSVIGGKRDGSRFQWPVDIIVTSRAHTALTAAA